MAVKSETRTFRVSCDCTAFTPYRFAWLNRLGGFDTFTFRLQNTRTINTKSKEFTRFLSTMKQDSGGAYYFGYSLGERGRTVYVNDVTEAFTVVSQWQTQEEHDWLLELFTSPAVYLVSGGVFDPIIITSNSVTRRNKDGWGNRLLSHTIEFVKAYSTIVQRS